MKFFSPLKNQVLFLDYFDLLPTQTQQLQPVQNDWAAAAHIGQLFRISVSQRRPLAMECPGLHFPLLQNQDLHLLHLFWPQQLEAVKNNNMAMAIRVVFN